MKNVKRLISILLILAMLVGFIPTSIVNAAPKTKTKVITFNELMDGNNRSDSVNIPNLKEVVSVKSNTGTATHSVSGEEVTVNIKGGAPSRQVNNPRKYSKTETSSSTSSNNSFSSTKSYNSGGYSGTLSNSGASKVISGSYTPAHSKDVTDTRFSQGSNSNPSSVSYNSGGYSGSLSRTNTTSNNVQTGGSYIPAHSKNVNQTIGPQSSSSFPSTKNYNNSGYLGTLNKNGGIKSSTTYNYNKYQVKETEGITLGNAYFKTITSEGRWSDSGSKGNRTPTAIFKYYPGKEITRNGLRPVGNWISFNIQFYFNGKGSGGVKYDSTMANKYGFRQYRDSWGESVWDSRVYKLTGRWKSEAFDDSHRNPYLRRAERLSYEVRDVTYGTTRVRGALVQSNIAGSSSQYPSNGEQGGYWYIRNTINNYSQNYSGTVTKPAVDTRTYRTDYTSHYSGTVTKPAVDTRTWEQDYSGTVYKAGSDDYYSYSVEIEYIDNTDPTIEVSSPSNGVKRSGVSGYNKLTVSGTTKDIDVGNKLTVKYKLSTGEAGSIANLTADGSNQSFSKAVDVSSLPTGSHSIAIWTEDDQGGKSSEVSRSFIVDKEKPVISFNDYIKTPINQDITAKASVNKGMLNKESHTFTKNGSFEFIATDEVGNVGKRTVVIDNIDKVKPVITIEDYTKTPTNKDIVVKAKTSKGTLNKTSHTFKENGSFEFIAQDEAGNIAKKKVTVTNIDKVKPIITIEDYIKTPTNKDIVVKAKTDKGELEVSSHVFKENGSFEFIARDISGNITKETVTVTNIDKIAPELKLTANTTKPTNQDVVITAKATDSGSGIDSITLPGGEVIKVDKATLIVEENGTYKFTAIDKAGNTTTEEITVSNIDKVPVVITIEDYIKSPTNKDIIVTAKINKGTLNKESHTFTENGSFTFKAEDKAGNKDEVTVKITNIDKTPPTKPEVCYINDEFMLKEGKDLESGIKKHLYSINNSGFKEWTKNLIANLFDDGDYDIRVKAVDKATNESEVGTFKVTLRYQEAERKVTQAESTLTRKDYDIAKDVVDTLNPGDIKDDLLQRLKDVLHKIIKKEFEDLVDGSEGEEDLKDAEEQIRDSDLDQDVKDGLLEKLNNKAIELATRAVELAEAMRREPYIGGAIVLVDKITPCEEKTALEDRIAAIKEVREGQLGAIDSNEENYEVKNAELDVKQAEALKREPFLTKAKVNVAHLPDSEEKTALEARLEALNQLLEGNSEEAIKGAERAVAQAEAIKREANLNSAKAVVDRLKKSVEKDNFLARLKAVEDYINNEDGKEEPEKPINSDTQIKRAEDAVKLAERFKRDAFINQARQAVERLKDSEEKTRFLERLDAIK